MVCREGPNHEQRTHLSHRGRVGSDDRVGVWWADASRATQFLAVDVPKTYVKFSLEVQR